MLYKNRKALAASGIWPYNTRAVAGVILVAVHLFVEKLDLAKELGTM
jgi:hypothetical protein